MLDIQKKAIEKDEAVGKAVDKLMGIKEYEVYASETVYYVVKVKAESMEQARQMARDGDIQFNYSDVFDGDHFTIDDVVEVVDDVET